MRRRCKAFSKPYSSTRTWPRPRRCRWSVLHLGEVVSAGLVSSDPAAEFRRKRELARRALDLGRDDAGILTRRRFWSGVSSRRFDTAADAIARARALNPNSAAALGPQGWIPHVWRGRARARAGRRRTARCQLSPSDIFAFAWWCVGSYAHFAWRQISRRAVHGERTLAGASGLTFRREDDCRSAALGDRPESVECRWPACVSSSRCCRLPILGCKCRFGRAEDLARLTDGLRKAGLPE